MKKQSPCSAMSTMNIVAGGLLEAHGVQFEIGQSGTAAGPARGFAFGSSSCSSPTQIPAAESRRSCSTKHQVRPAHGIDHAPGLARGPLGRGDLADAPSS